MTLFPYTTLFRSYLTGIIKVAAGADHVLALAKDGHVYAWGNNSFGQIGNGLIGEKVAYPTMVNAGAQGGSDPYLSDIVDIAAGRTFSIAVDKNGYVYTFGRNVRGVLGINRTDLREDLKYGSQTMNGFSGFAEQAEAETQPVKVMAGILNPEYDPDNQQMTPNQIIDETAYLRDIVAVAAGDAHAVALDRYGNVWAWGDNSYGQLGNSRPTTNQPKILNRDGTVVANMTTKLLPGRVTVDNAWQIGRAHV